MRHLSKRARRLLALAACLAVIASAAGLAVSLRGGSRAQPAAASGTSKPAAPGSTQAQADLGRMQALLNGGSVSAQAALLVPPLQFAPGSGPIVPAGKTIMVRPGTFRSSGQRGTVQARVSDGTTVTLELYAAQGHWRLYGAQAGSAQTRASVTPRPGGAARAQLMSYTPPATFKACPAKDEIGTRTPVILVHGFNGHASDWGSNDPGNEVTMYHQVDMIRGVWTTAFDYYPTSTQWVDNLANGPALAKYIHCVAQASPDGKVVIVAYSLGGLLTRYAATTGGVEKDIAMVITIATPNTGSFEANVFGFALGLFCYKTGQPEVCQQLSAVGAMAAFGSQIQGLGELPPGIALHAIAGDETLNWGIWRARVEVPLHGDGVMFASSSLHKRPGGTDDTFWTYQNPLVSGDTSALHIPLPKTQAVIAKVHDYIYAWVQSHPAPAPAPVQSPAAPAASPALGGDAYWLANGGQWYVHGVQLQISQGPSGLVGTETWNAQGAVITGTAHLAFTSQPDGSLVGTYTTGTTYTSSSGASAGGFQEPGAPQQGQVVELRPVAPMHAESVLGNESPIMFSGGNVNWCQAGLPDASQYCGA